MASTPSAATRRVFFIYRLLGHDVQQANYGLRAAPRTRTVTTRCLLVTEPDVGVKREPEWCELPGVRRWHSCHRRLHRHAPRGLMGRLAPRIHATAGTQSAGS